MDIEFWVVLKVIGVLVLLGLPFGIMRNAKEEYGIPMFSNAGFFFSFGAVIFTYVTIFVTDGVEPSWNGDVVTYYLGIVGLLGVAFWQNKSRGLGFVPAVILTAAQFFAALTTIGLIFLVFLLLSAAHDD